MTPVDNVRFDILNLKFFLYARFSIKFLSIITLIFLSITLHVVLLLLLAVLLLLFNSIGCCAALLSKAAKAGLWTSPAHFNLAFLSQI